MGREGEINMMYGRYTDLMPLACNPGMHPHQGLNQQPPSSLAGTQSNEPHQPGLSTPLLRTPKRVLSVRLLTV